MSWCFEKKNMTNLLKLSNIRNERLYIIADVTETRKITEPATNGHRLDYLAEMNWLAET